VVHCKKKNPVVWLVNGVVALYVMLNGATALIARSRACASGRSVKRFKGTSCDRLTVPIRNS
jgi:hypothetical protein